MANELKFFSVRIKGEEFPLSLGRSENKVAALDKLNGVLAKGDWPQVKKTGKNIVLLEHKPEGDSEYPLTIEGEGCERIAKIGS